MSPRPNTSDLYSPVNDEPAGHAGPRRYVHVIGATVFVDDQIADDVVDAPRRRRARRRGAGGPSTCPQDADDPLVRLGARPASPTSAGRARPSGSPPAAPCSSSSGPAPTGSADAAARRPSRRPASGRCSARRAACWPIPASRAGDDHARHPRRAPDPTRRRCSPGACSSGADVLVPRRFRRARRGRSKARSSARSTRRSASPSATCSYRVSQPWPFPHSLMIGFRARVRGRATSCSTRPRSSTPTGTAATRCRRSRPASRSPAS